jgi:hypothetical protein
MWTWSSSAGGASMIACQPTRWQRRGGGISPASRATCELRPSAPITSSPRNSPREVADDTGIGIEAGDRRLGKKLRAGALGLAAQPVIEHLAADDARSAIRGGEVVRKNRRPSQWMAKPVELWCGSAAKLSARPSRRQIGHVEGLTQFPHTFARGKRRAVQQRHERLPARASTSAASEPAGAAPTMTASWDMGLG